MAAARSLVVVARPDPATTDELADRLRERCTVRTAYSVDDVLDRLDDEVDAVLVDPAFATDVVAVVREALDDRGLDCQVGLLTDGSGDEATATVVDAVVPPTAGDERVRETVEWLAMRATYRKVLDEYYELAQTSATLQGFAGQRDGDDEGNGDAPLDHDRGVESGTRRNDDGTANEDGGDGAPDVDDVEAELDRLQGQIEGLRRQLDETAEQLDTLSLFEAALRRDPDG